MVVTLTGMLAQAKKGGVVKPEQLKELEKKKREAEDRYKAIQKAFKKLPKAA